MKNRWISWGDGGQISKCWVWLYDGWSISIDQPLHGYMVIETATRIEMRREKTWGYGRPAHEDLSKLFRETLKASYLVIRVWMRISREKRQPMRSWMHRVTPLQEIFVFPGLYRLVMFELISNPICSDEHWLVLAHMIWVNLAVFSPWHNSSVIKCTMLFRVSSWLILGLLAFFFSIVNCQWWAVLCSYQIVKWSSYLRCVWAIGTTVIVPYRMVSMVYSKLASDRWMEKCSSSNRIDLLSLSYGDAW